MIANTNPETHPVHTPGHLACPACDLYRLRIIEPQAFGRLRFSDAAPIWLDDHKSSISQRTHSDYLYYIRTLDRFFSELPLSYIHIGHVNSYVQERSATANAASINHEINTLKQILSLAGLWLEIAKFYRPLRIPQCDVGQAMEPEDEKRLFAIAEGNPRWRIAYWSSILTATTTAAPCEISHLHVNDVELGERPGAPWGTLRIRDGLKNGHRERVVPLNESSRWAAAQMLRRYYKLCAKYSVEACGEHYILPGRARASSYDFSRPIGSWKKAWGQLRAKAGLPTLRMYDLRHHAITKLMEDPEISEQTVEEMAGHALSSRMKKRYSHIRLKPKAAAAAKLELQLPPLQLPPKKPVASERNIADELDADAKV
ncbi:MAG TPA: hypothetical protein VN622_10860 [Clostridia bacterium]|nr:hypothetical protein [Clostridia bacterium]